MFLFLGGELPIGFLNVLCLLSRASFSTIFNNNCGRDEILGTTTCHKSVVGGKQGHAPCKIQLLQQILFLCQLHLIEIMRLS